MDTDHIKRLQEELDRASKFLVQRDIKLMEMNRTLQEVDRSKSEFISIVAHQLRTPLTAIKWSVEGLAHSDTCSDADRAQLADIQQSTDHLIDLINALLSLSRIELGTFEVTYVDIDIAALCNKALHNAAGHAQDKDVIIHKAYPETIPFVTDKALCTMICENLISNAVKYTPHEGTVTVAARIIETSLQITITDTGIGIPEAEQKQLFEKFYRASNVQDGYDGTGLGLYIVQLAVDKLDGTLVLDSTEGHGTTFTITLPQPSTTPTP